MRRYVLERLSRDCDVRAALSAGNVLGFIAASRETIIQLYVRRDHPRRGIGTRLIDWAKAQSDRTSWLYTFAVNAGAQRFYERRGFTVAARGIEPESGMEDLRYEMVTAERINASSCGRTGLPHIGGREIDGRADRE